MSLDDWYFGGEVEWGEDDPDWVDDQKIVEVSFDILVHTTKDAYLLQIGEKNVWFPKSQATINMSMNNNTVLIPKWLADQKELGEHYTQEEKAEVEETFNRVIRKNIKDLGEDVPF